MSQKNDTVQLMGSPGNSINQALSGLKVIEIGNNIAVAYCCKLMADLGAKVIKVEDPRTGNLDRQERTLWSSEEGEKRGCLFAYVNTSKLGISLNLDNKLGQSILYDLVRDADILVQGNLPQRAKEMGLEFESLSKVNNMLVVTSVTPFGQDGPYRDYKAYAINCNAAGGSSMTIGQADRTPLSHPLAQAHYQSGCMAAVATLGAILAREFIGSGQHIDISEVEVWLTHHTGFTISGFVFHGRKRMRLGYRNPAGFPNGTLECKDGYIFYTTIRGGQWKNFLKIVGDGDIPNWYASDPRFPTTRWQELNIKYADEIEAHLAPWMKQHTKQEIFKLGREKDIAIAPVQQIGEVMEEPHFKERGYFVELDSKEFGKLKYPGAPYRFSQTPARIQCPAPVLGQHNEEIYCSRLRYSKEDLSRLRQEGVI